VTEDRIERLEARFELADLAVRYCHLLDAKEFDRVVTLFDEDASFTTPSGTVTGRAELAAFFARQLSRYDAWWHYPHSHVVDFVDAGAASGVVEAHAEHAQDGVCVVAGIRYEDEYRRGDDGWRFAARTLQIRYFLPSDRLATAYRHSAAFPLLPPREHP